LLFSCFYFVWTWKPAQPFSIQNPGGYNNSPGAQFGLLPPVGLDKLTQTPNPTLVNEMVLTLMPTLQETTLSVESTTVIPVSTALPIPTAVKIAVPTELIIEMGKFSFYDPLIGRDKPEIALTNCANWDTEKNDCLSMLRDGTDFRAQYFRAAACRYDLFIARAKFKVLAPEWLKTLFPDGFTCVDTGDAVNGIWFDFLIPWRSMPFPWEQTPWGTPIALLRTN